MLAEGEVPEPVVEFVEAISSGDTGALRETVAYILDDRLIDGSALPEECLATEVDALVALGITRDSEVRVEQEHRTGVRVEGMEQPVDYSYTLAFFAVTGGEEGRQLEFHEDRWWVVLLPNAACDALVRAAGV